MTTSLQPLADGRLYVESLDGLSSTEAMDLLRGYQIEHVVYRNGHWDAGLAAWAGNWGVRFHQSEGDTFVATQPCRVLVIGR